jgi:hypothetical protein
MVGRGRTVPPGARFVRANEDLLVQSEDAFYSFLDNLPITKYRYGNLNLGDVEQDINQLRLMTFEEMIANNAREEIRRIQSLEEFYNFLVEGDIRYAELVHRVYDPNRRVLQREPIHLDF